MSNINDNSLSSYGQSHPNRGLTLENLSVKSLNKNLNKSINSMNNSMHKSGKIAKKISDPSSKNAYKSKNSNTNSKKNLSKNIKNKSHQPKSKSSSSNNQNTNNIYNKSSSNNSNPILISQSSSNNRLDEEQELYNYFYYNDVCEDNDLYLLALNDTLSILDNIFNELDLISKIKKLLELTNDESKNIRLGSLVGLYFLIKNNFNSLDEKIKINIITIMISLLQSYEKQDELFLLSCLEICTLFCPH